MDLVNGISALIRVMRGLLSGGSVSKKSACNAGEKDSIPGLGRSPGEGNSYSSLLFWRIPWTEEPGRPQSMGLQKIDMTET